MKNQAVESVVLTCDKEMDRIDKILTLFSSFVDFTPFLSRYALIRCCGTIELCFKILLADGVSSVTSPEANSFINKKFAERALNPGFKRFMDAVGDFDLVWKKNIEETIGKRSDKDEIKQSVASLRELRNEFAHGGQPNASFSSIKKYYEDSKLILNEIDKIVSK